MRHTVVAVEWRDAYSYTEEWATVEEIDKEPVIVQSIGFLLADAKDGYVVIAQSDDGQGQLDGFLFIPCGMVLNLRVVSDVRGVPFSAVSG